MRHSHYRVQPTQRWRIRDFRGLLGKCLAQHSTIAGENTALVSIPGQQEDTVSAPTALGDIVAHKSYVLHRATPNRTNLDRIALVVVVGASPRPRFGVHYAASARTA